jgi:hypothetical protein
MKICLNLSGQVKLRPDETLKSRIKHFKDIFNFDKIFMHFWLSDFLTFQEEISEIEQIYNCSYIITDIPDFKQDIVENVNNLKHHFNDKSKDLLCQFYGIQEVFQKSNFEDFDVHIKCGYDNKFENKFNFDKYSYLLLENEPVAIVPSGGDWCEGLADRFYIMNKSCSSIMNNILNDTIELTKLKFPFHPQTILRTFLINLNNAKVYRIPYAVSLIHGNDNCTVKLFKNDFCILDNKKFIPKISNDIDEAWIENFETLSNDFENKLFLNKSQLFTKKINIKINQMQRIGDKYSYNNDKIDTTWLSDNIMDPINSASYFLDLKMIENQKQQISNFKLKDNKIFLNDFAFVLITKIDSEQRLSNLKANVKHLNNFFENKIMIYELDNNSKINFDGNFEKILLKPKGNSFDRNYAANEIYKTIDFKYILNIETDVIFDPLGIKDCYDNLIEMDLTLAMPFNGLAIWLNEKSANEYIKNQKLPEIWKNVFNISNFADKYNLDSCTLELLDKARPKHPGFCYLINLTKFKAIGGENENFKRHGYDDVERIYRVLKFGNSIYWSDYFAYHLWHPRNAKDHYYEPQRESKDELIRIVRMNLDELQNEVMSWRGFSS